MKRIPNCMATVDRDRINLIISRRNPDYIYFTKILNKISMHGMLYWYGATKDNNGNEIDGLVITSK